MSCPLKLGRRTYDATDWQEQFSAEGGSWGAGLGRGNKENRCCESGKDLLSVLLNRSLAGCPL